VPFGTGVRKIGIYYHVSVWGNEMTSIAPGYVGKSSVTTGQVPEVTLSVEEKVIKIIGPMTEQDRTRFLEFFPISGISADNEAAVLDFYRNYRQHLTPGESISEAQRIFLNATGMDDKTLMARAILLDKVHLIPDLVACGAEVSKPCVGPKIYTLMTPLFLAARFNHPACIPLLKAAGADVDEVDHSGNSPLAIAARNDNEAVCTALIAAGANVDARNNYGASPLLHAITENTDAIVKQLLARNATWEKNCCAALIRSSSLLLRLIDSKTPLPLDQLVGEAMSPKFTQAVFEYNMPIVIRLLESGADANATVETGRTLLQEASYRDDILFVQHLLKLGADVDRTDDRENTALSLALKNGNREVATLLFNHGAQLRSQDHADYRMTFPPAPGAAPFLI
jgi:ankyrin repeat protein